MASAGIEPRPVAPVNYLPAMSIVALLAVILIGMILYLRPAYDPLLVITGVTGMFATLGTAMLSFMKSQETHLSVNSQLDAWKKEFARMVKAETTVENTAEAKAAAAAPAPVAVAAVLAPAPPEPEPVKVVVVADADTPIPVVVQKK